MAEWREVVGFPAYEVSNDGQVRSYWIVGCRARIADTPQKVMSPGHDGSGYEMVFLYTGAGISKMHKVANLVIGAFLGPRPDGMHVCHNNSIRCDNRIENLRYDTHAGNFADKSESARRAATRKLTDQQVIDIRVSNVVDGITQAVLAEKYGVAGGTISRVCTGYSYAHLPGPRTTDKYIPTEVLKQHTARTWV